MECLPHQAIRIGRLTEIRMDLRHPAAICKRISIAGVKETLRWQSFCQHDIMLRQFDVVVRDCSDLHLPHRRAIRQIFDRDQDVLYEHGVIRRQEQSAARSPMPESVHLGADRPHRMRMRMPAAVHSTMADPLDRPRASRHRPYLVAGTQILHGLHAIAGFDQRAGGEARYGRAHHSRRAVEREILLGIATQEAQGAEIRRTVRESQKCLRAGGAECRTGSHQVFDRHRIPRHESADCGLQVADRGQSQRLARTAGDEVHVDPMVCAIELQRAASADGQHASAGHIVGHIQRAANRGYRPIISDDTGNRPVTGDFSTVDRDGIGLQLAPSEFDVTAGPDSQVGHVNQTACHDGEGASAPFATLCATDVERRSVQHRTGTLHRDRTAAADFGAHLDRATVPFRRHDRRTVLNQ